MLEPCVWCDAPSKFRCGACRETTFCSAACQKTTWPIHKHLCGAPNGAFRQAPLDEREAAAMDILKDEMHGHPPNAWIWQKQLDLYTAGVPEFREWKNVRAAMAAPAAKPPFPMPDGAREYAVAFARAHLNFHDHYTQYYDKRKLRHTIEAALLTCVETKINSHGHGRCRCAHGENYQLDVHAEMAVLMAGYLRETAYIQLGLCLLMDEDEEATVEQKREWARIVRQHYIFINDEIREAPVESNMKAASLATCHDHQRCPFRCKQDIELRALKPRLSRPSPLLYRNFQLVPLILLVLLIVPPASGITRTPHTTRRRSSNSRELVLDVLDGIPLCPTLSRQNPPTIDDMVQANCTWCEKPSSMRCGACHKTSFCSAECQKITWPIHKAVCGAETDVFRQAPLTQKEMLALDGIKDRLYGSEVPGEGEVFSKYMLSLCDGTSSLQSWQDIRAVLIAPITSVPLNVPDGIREMLISYSRAHLSICGHYPSEMCLDRVWHFAASALTTCASELLTAKPQPMMTAALMVKHMAIATRVLNGYLRSTVWIAQAVTLLTTQKDSAPSDKRKWWFRLLLMHCKEQLDEVGAAKIDPAVRRSLQRCCEGCRAEYEALFVAGRFGVFTE